MPLCKLLAAVWVLPLLFLGACEPSGPPCESFRVQRDDALEEAKRADLRAKRLIEENRLLRDRVRNVRGGGVDPMKYAFLTESIDIGRYSGGLNTDKVPGTDSVVVFIETKDRQGSTIKAAGGLRVRLFDLAQPKGKTVIAEKTVGVADCGEYFHAGTMGYHYRVELPLKPPPTHPELTIQVEFVDAISGRTFRAQKAVAVELPAAPAETSP